MRISRTDFHDHLESGLLLNAATSPDIKMDELTFHLADLPDEKQYGLSLESTLVTGGGLKIL